MIFDNDDFHAPLSSEWIRRPASQLAIRAAVAAKALHVPHIIQKQ
jgi:hypothetical protein